MNDKFFNLPLEKQQRIIKMCIRDRTSPMLTAEWEQKLTGIARGEADPSEFLAGITGMTQELVKNYSHISEEGQKLFAPERETVGLCPRCGKPVYEGKKNFYCSDRSCQFVLWKDDRFWTCLLYTSATGCCSSTMSSCPLRTTSRRIPNFTNCSPPSPARWNTRRQKRRHEYEKQTVCHRG